MLNEWIQVHINWNLIININLGWRKYSQIISDWQFWSFIIGRIYVIWIIIQCSLLILVHSLILLSKISLLTTFSMIDIVLGVKIPQWDISGLWDVSGCMRHLSRPPWSCHSVFGLRQAWKYLQSKVNNVETEMVSVGRNYALLKNKRGFTEAVGLADR